MHESRIDRILGSVPLHSPIIKLWRVAEIRQQDPTRLHLACSALRLRDDLSDTAHRLRAQDNH